MAASLAVLQLGLVRLIQWHVQRTSVDLARKAAARAWNLLPGVFQMVVAALVMFGRRLLG